MEVSKSQRKKIREYFKNDVGFPKRIDARVARREGFDTLNEYYANLSVIMDDEEKTAKEAREKEAYERKKAYNVERNRRIRFEKKVKEFQRKRLSRLIDKRFGYFPFTELEDRIRRTGVDLNSPFTITLQSSTTRGQRTWRFNNFFHMMTWFNQIYNENNTGSEGNEENGEYLHDNAFQFVKIIEISNLAGGFHSNDQDKYMELDLDNFKFKLFSPKNQKNNCAFKCLEAICGKLKDTEHNYRKMFGVAPKTLMPIDKVVEIYEKQCMSKFLTILEPHTKIALNFNTNNYMLLHKNHYYVVEEAESKAVVPPKREGIRRGWCFWDIETRPISQDSYVVIGKYSPNPIKSYILADTLLCAYTKDFNAKEWVKHVFVSNDKEGACRQFLNWLIKQSWDGKHYNCVAHNGARFDNYFMINAMTKDEQIRTKMNLRGTSVIGMEFANHQFRDSCCFIASSLENICKSYGIKNAKRTEFELRGVKLTNGNIWAYRPELSAKEFLRLKESEPDYWNEYEDYCMMDCISLSEIWLKFIKETNELIYKIGAHLLKTCSVQSALTIGSLAKKILVKLNKGTKEYKEMTRFVGDDEEKYKFVSKFKIGGISHCNQPGKHNHAVVSYDITSQYPTAMNNMRVPCGESRFIYHYDEDAYGFYEIANMVWKDEAKAFKPVCGTNVAGIRNWNKLGETMLADSFMIKYLKEHTGLVSFDVVKGLVSKKFVRGQKLFNKYVYILFSEKAKQDELKEAKSDDYNAAYREVIKLFLNSVSGKLVEDSSKYFNLVYTTDKTKNSLNGVGCDEEKTEKKYNPWLVCGCMVYSYSKRLLFEYIRCLPNGSDDVINVETDSLYFDKRCQIAFEDNVRGIKSEYPVKIGAGMDAPLGCMKNEYDTNEVSYFLEKKFYTIGGSMKIKSIPLKTVDRHGNTVQLVSKNWYERVYKGETIEAEFNTMKKNLWGQTKISSHTMKRIVRPMNKYSEYN